MSEPEHSIIPLEVQPSNTRLDSREREYGYLIRHFEFKITNGALAARHIQIKSTHSKYLFLIADDGMKRVLKEPKPR